jgi:GH15 family glucan-1,4-alpha-glucosidase
MTPRIEDYALIGDCETAALVGRDGSIDWLCWPRFDSQACFARLLGTEENGRWLIAPLGEAVTRRRYRSGTLILETEFETGEGAATLIDFMPLRGVASDVVRIVVGRSGCVKMRMELVIRFDYGRFVPWVTTEHKRFWRAIGGPHAVYLQSGAAIEPQGFTSVSNFEVQAGERIPFTLTYQKSHLPEPEPVDPQAAIKETEEFWREWIDRSRYEGRWREAVERSLITIKAMTYRPTGGIVAAPTTSLPAPARSLLVGVLAQDRRARWRKPCLPSRIGRLCCAGISREPGLPEAH